MSDAHRIPAADASQDDPQMTATTVVGVVSIALLVACVLLLELLYQRTAEGEYRRKVVEQPAAELVETRTRQLEQLGRYGVREEGILTIPIERAMQLVIDESKSGAIRGREGS